MNVRTLVSTSIAVSVIGLSGCTVVGSSEPICDGDYVTGVCTNSENALNVIEADNVDAYVSQHGDSSISESEYRAGTRISKYDTVIPAVPVGSTMTQPLHEPKPVLQTPSVMYVVVAAWQSKAGYLNYPSTHLIEIAPKNRWSFGVKDAVKFEASSPFSVVK
ncbi:MULTISPECIES: hypothetical protein [Vibrio]|uniref:Type IV conjugative transfer system protein TraV n=2 Tax=Vibrio TaxID=662 RepID=A0A510IJ65_9VIBR|nr:MULTISPECIES: hypothetical protein [Vibrio]RTZ24625.1 hypothetical protein EKN09_02905 [Vibrio penaeicida]BBL92260.1 hypothetical protein VroAM7_49130 [Vibrio rotiferianus]GLQ71125.1 hypothetical protein GCM10007932_04850 [Vibrio penaeicida]CCN40260.1 exported hypothetical protein [Vibrio nigripulchritudo FTn2]